MTLERTLVPNLPLVSTKLAKNGGFTLGNEPSCETMISPLVHTIVENKPCSWWRTILLALVRSIYLMENHPLAVGAFHLPDGEPSCEVHTDFLWHPLCLLLALCPGGCGGLWEDLQWPPALHREKSWGGGGQAAAGWRAPEEEEEAGGGDRWAEEGRSSGPALPLTQHKPSPSGTNGALLNWVGLKLNWPSTQSLLWVSGTGCTSSLNV